MESKNNQPEVFCRYNDGGSYYGKVHDDFIYQLDKEPWSGGKETGVKVKKQDVKILTPSEPRTIVGLGKLYSESWVNKIPPTTVRWFIKPHTSAAADGEEIILPPTLDEVKVECELVIVIGKKIKNVDEDEACNAIFGYTIGNDIMGTVESYHRLQRDHKDMEEPLLAPGLKSCDGFQPFGPYIYSNIDWKNRKLTLEVSYKNSSQKIFHEQNTSTLIFTPEKMVSDLSKVFTLSPGDIISTGTIKAFIAKPGAKVKIVIDGFGELVNYLKKKKNNSVT